MNNIFNRDNEPWIRPWNQEKFDDLYNRDERFFGIIIKGLISWLNKNIVLYNKSINHFIFNTGSSYLYIESNGYEYSVTETTGEDTMYMELPRCILELVDVNIPTEDLSSPYSRGYYERRSGNMLCGYNAEIKRIPIELTINAKYYLSNFNESIVLLQELIDKIVFQKYFKITYLGQEIQCSIEYPGNMNPQLNKIDMTSPEPNQRNITLDLKICSNYPVINTRTEISTDKVIAVFGSTVDIEHKGTSTDKDRRGKILKKQNDGYDEMKIELKELSNKESEVIDHEEEDILSKLDINKDGVINKDDIIKILDNIKYDNYNEDIDINNDKRINYDDLCKILKILNSFDNLNIDYDEYMNKIYINHTDTNEFEEIDLTKYKIE